MKLISRDEAIKQIEEAFDMGECNCDRFALRGILKSLPAIERREWVPIKKIPMDAEERAEYSVLLGHDLEDDEAVMYSNLPEDGETVLVSTEFGYVTVDTFVQDDMGCYFEDNMDMEGIVAWMPLPKPYDMERSE